MPNRKFWNIAKRKDGHADIYLEGDIVNEKPVNWFGEVIDGNYITPDGFKEDLESVSDSDNITVHINSCGGDVYTSIAIYNAIHSLNKNVTVVVDGVALSGASVIAMAGNSVEMYPGSLMMIHGVSTVLMRGAYGVDDFSKFRNACDAMEKAIATIYSIRTKKTVIECREMMNAETWMTGADAVENGFADRVIDDGVNVDIAFDNRSNVLFVNKVEFDAENMNIPEKIARIREDKDENVPKKAKNAQNKDEKGEKAMDLDELKKKYPDLVNQIQTEAVNQERTRIHEIDEISANISDEKAINDAKYGENPINASELALNYLKTAKNLGQKFVNDLEKGAVESGTNSVTALPTENQQEKSQESKDFDEGKMAVQNIAKLFNA